MKTSATRLTFSVVLCILLAAPPVSVAGAHDNKTFAGHNQGDKVKKSARSSILIGEYLTIDSLPTRGQMWSQCTDASQAYCVEGVHVISPSGQEMSHQAFARASCGGYSPGTREKCKVDGSDHVEVNVDCCFSETEMANTYRWKMRTGRIEPSVLMLGDTQKTDVVFTDGVGWTIEVWAKPALRAYDGCSSPTVCDDNSVAGYTKIGLSGYLRMLGVGDGASSADTVETRDSLRGTFISTNAMSQSWEFRSDTLFVDALSPHFLPDGKTLSPGFVKVFIPSAYLLGPRGFTDLAAVTMNKISVTLKGRQAAPSLTTLDNGVLIDTGVTHYSNPQPKVRVKPQRRSLRKKSKTKLSAIYATKKSQKPRWSTRGACSIKRSRLVAGNSGTCTVTVRVLRKGKYVVGSQRTFRVR
jgi:hypothetical protein